MFRVSPQPPCRCPPRRPSFVAELHLRRPAPGGRWVLREGKERERSEGKGRERKGREGGEASPASSRLPAEPPCGRAVTAAAMAPPAGRLLTSPSPSSTAQGRLPAASPPRSVRLSVLSFCPSLAPSLRWPAGFERRRPNAAATSPRCRCRPAPRPAPRSPPSPLIAAPSGGRRGREGRGRNGRGERRARSLPAARTFWKQQRAAPQPR